MVIEGYDFVYNQTESGDKDSYDKGHLVNNDRHN